jgi:hypothetical protein
VLIGLGQQAASPVERIVLAAPMTRGVVLHAAAALIESLWPHPRRVRRAVDRQPTSTLMTAGPLNGAPSVFAYRHGTREVKLVDLDPSSGARRLRGIGYVTGTRRLILLISQSDFSQRLTDAVAARTSTRLPRRGVVFVVIGAGPRVSSGTAVER